MWKRFMTLAIKAVLSIAMAVTLIACETIKEQGKIDTFNLTVKEYAKYIRWSRFQDAMSLQKLRGGSPDPVDWEHLKQVRVSSYEVLDLAVNPNDQNLASAKVEYSYYLNGWPVVKESSMTQHWWYDESNERWFLDAELPKFK
jgi:hypothetical protein